MQGAIRLAQGLAALGATRGDRVAILHTAEDDTGAQVAVAGVVRALYATEQVRKEQVELDSDTTDTTRRP